MVGINEIDTINNKFEEQKNENRVQPEFSGGYFNDTVNFDREKFGQKPDPFFGFAHDPYVQSSEDPEKLKEIEKAKRQQITMSKTSSSGFFNVKDKANGISNYQNNPNLSNFNKFNKTNRNYAGSMANNLGGVGQLNIDSNINGNSSGLNETKKMNRTSVGFRPMKQTYEEKLDSFMLQNNLKYIEPQKAEKKPLQATQSQPDLIKPNKLNAPNGSANNANKKIANKKQ